jgi:hypothetical protein
LNTASAPRYLNRYLHTDVLPFEVVRVVSATTVEIRAMVATIDPTWQRDFRAGGFFGHTANNDSQRYAYASDASAPILRARRTKSGAWSVAGDARYMAADAPHKFHDYNF